MLNRAKNTHLGCRVKQVMEGVITDPVSKAAYNESVYKEEDIPLAHKGTL